MARTAEWPARPAIPLVISHRTHAGSRPENSLEGITAALEEGVDGIELDVRAPADGVPMLLHDATLDRTHTDPRPLAALTSSEAGALGVPTLAEVLALVAAHAPRTLLCIEVKEAGLGESVAREVHAAHAEGWSWIWAFDPAVASECRAALPEVPVALNADPASQQLFAYTSPIEVALERGLAAISLDHRMVTPTLVDDAHARGLLVFTWTPNTPPDIEAVLSAAVDGICSDHPDLVRTALTARAPQFELRSATRADLDVLYPIYRACYEDYVRQTWGAWDETQQRTGYFEGFPLDRARVITVGRQIIGAIDVERRDESWWLNNIEIAPEWQNRGIGTALVREVLEHARLEGVPAELGCMKVNPARRLYERLGFRVIGETETHYLMRALR